MILTGKIIYLVRYQEKSVKSITVLKYQTKKSMKEVKDGWYESAIALATSVWGDDNDQT